MKKPRQWKMWAHEDTDHQGQLCYLHCGDKWFVELHGLSLPVVPVVLTESPKGKFLGWLETGTKEPCMIWHERIFEICFPYGSAAEVKAGKGAVVRLEIRKDVRR